MLVLYPASIAIIIPAIWILIRSGESKWLVALGFAGIDILFSFANVIQGGFSINLFTLQQSKRLGGIVRSGIVCGVFLAGFSVGLIVKFVGTVDLLLASGISAVLAVILGIRIITVFRARFRKGGHSDTVERSSDAASLKDIFRNPYVRLLFASFIASFVTFYFLDFMFLNELDRKYPSPEDLAGFYGIFFGVGSVLTFLGQTFVYTNFVTRFGLLATMIALPIAWTTVAFFTSVDVILIGVSVVRITAVSFMPGLSWLSGSCRPSTLNRKSAGT
jgi:ATP/ADP translocase